MGFCAACGQPGDHAAKFCGACGAPTAAAAGAGGRGGDRAPDDTPVLDAFGDLEAFGGIFRAFRVARSGAWPVEQATGPEGPYDQLYAPRRDEPLDWVAPVPPPAAPASRDRAPARRRGGRGDTEAARPYGAASGGQAPGQAGAANQGPGPRWRYGEAPRDSGPPRQYGESWDPGPYRQYGESWGSGPYPRDERAGGESGPLQQHGGESLGSDPLRYYGWMRRPSPAVGSRKRITLAVLAVIALVAGGAGMLGYGMYPNHPPPITPAAQRAAGGSGPGPAARASSAPAELGNSTVAVTPAVASVPAARPIVSLLTSYFRAVNAHDYVAYRRLLDPRMKADMTAARFGTGYRSTEDSQATLTGVSATRNGGATADIMFTSHQSPSDSPDRTACTNWTLKLFLERAQGGYLIGESPPGYRPAHQPC